MAVEKDLQEGKEDTIVVAKRDGTRFTVDHFMALTEHKPHASMLEVYEKQDGFFYRLVDNNPHRIRYYKQLGYEIVTDDEDAMISDDTQPDGRRIAGANELVLMKQPEELHAMHRAALDRKAQRAKRGPIESFKNKARQMGFETIDTTREYVGPIEAAVGEKDDD